MKNFGLHHISTIENYKQTTTAKRAAKMSVVETAIYVLRLIASLRKVLRPKKYGDHE